MKIIIDPSLIWFDEKPETSEQFEYLYSAMNFIGKYLDARILKSTEKMQLLYNLNKDPFSEYREIKQRKTEIVKKIWNQLDDKVIELNDKEYVLKNIKLSKSDKGNE